MLDNIESIAGYDLVFVLSVVIRSQFSGNLIVVNEKFRFYFLWIKIQSAYFDNFLLDISKAKSEISKINPIIVGLAEYHYVEALISAILKNKAESLVNYNNAVALDKDFSRVPIYTSA